MIQKLLAALAKTTGFGGAIYYATTNFDLAKIISVSENTPETYVASGFLMLAVILGAYYIVNDTALVIGECIKGIYTIFKDIASKIPRAPRYPPYMYYPPYQAPPQNMPPQNMPPQNMGPQNTATQSGIQQPYPYPPYPPQ